MRHSRQLIRKIIRLRNSGFTLGEIIIKTGLSKTTIYHYIKTMPRSEILTQKIKAKTLAVQKAVADRRRGKSIKNYEFRRPATWNSSLVKLIAHFLFDGSITRVSCIYYSRSQVLRDEVIKAMERELGVHDYRIYSTAGGVKRVCYFNVELASLVKEKAKELTRRIIDASKEHKISFLRAFFDDEGCVTFSNKKRTIRGYQHSLPILELIKKLLDEFGIESKIDKKYFELYIYRKKNILGFNEFINFTPGVKVNGNRSNSIWKKSLEKRQILQMAINSYL